MLGKGIVTSVLDNDKVRVASPDGIVSPPIDGNGATVSVGDDVIYILFPDGTGALVGKGGGGEGVSDYNLLSNRPSLNNVVLTGNRDVAEHPLTNAEIEAILT
jgi:hypothetical protein